MTDTQKDKTLRKQGLEMVTQICVDEALISTTNTSKILEKNKMNQKELDSQLEQISKLKTLLINSDHFPPHIQKLIVAVAEVGKETEYDVSQANVNEFYDVLMGRFNSNEIYTDFGVVKRSERGDN